MAGKEQENQLISFEMPECNKQEIRLDFKLSP
jgi:hypothetical protein